MVTALSITPSRQAVDETPTIKLAELIANDPAPYHEVLSREPVVLQALLVRLCSPVAWQEPSAARKARLDALMALANQGLSVNGLAGTTTALHKACSTAAVDFASALLTLGANPRAQDEEGKAPSQKIPLTAPERSELMHMLRVAELRMTAMQAIQDVEPVNDMTAGPSDVLVARAYRGAAKKMGA